MVSENMIVIIIVKKWSHCPLQMDCTEETCTRRAENKENYKQCIFRNKFTTVWQKYSVIEEFNWYTMLMIELVDDGVSLLWFLWCDNESDNDIIKLLQYKLR